MKPDDFCSQFTPVSEEFISVTTDTASRLRVMANLLTNGHPILPLPDNINALRRAIGNETAPKDTAADHPAG